MRTTFIKTLTELARNDDRVFLITGDLGFSVVEAFAEEFPDRFLNAGVAEQDMTGIAAGLSREGYVVFTYSIANFPTLRCMEQIRYDICYHGANVKIVSVGAGFAYGPLGVSHHATEDIGMLRIIPGMTVIAPGDPAEVRAATEYLVRTEGPAYMRLNKNGEPTIHGKQLRFDQPRSLEILHGNGTAVLCTGAILADVRQEIAERRLGWGLYSFPFIKPIDKDTIASICGEYPCVVCIEEHQRSGGFGSAVLETVNDLQTEGRITEMPAVRRIGLDDVFLKTAGDQRYLRRAAGISLARVL